MSDGTPAVEPSGLTFYPDELQARDWWVNWVLAVRHEEMDGGEPAAGAVPTKQPVAPYDNGTAEPAMWHSGLSDEEHPSTTFDEVQNWDGWPTADLPTPDRVLSDELSIGIITPVGGGDGRPIVLLDWDDVRDPETGEVHPVCAWALEELGGYAEISQSGEGIHQFAFGEIPGGMKKFLRHIDDDPFVGDDLPMVEMYASGRLTAMTGRHVDGTGEDVVEGQDLIDELCWRFGQASNNSTDTPTDPFASERDDGQAGGGEDVPGHDEIGRAIREAIEFDGDYPDDWDVPDERVKYAAVLRGRERSDELTNTANWELIGYAAALGKELGLSKADILGDLKAHPTPQYGFDERRAKKEIRGIWRKMDEGHISPPSVQTLKERGLLPDDYAVVDELRNDDRIPGRAAWAAWKEARLGGDIGEDAVVPETALEYIARDRGMYDFDTLPEGFEGLPAKAHNKALGYVRAWWDEETPDDVEADATARSMMRPRAEESRTWEDVRYIYDDDVKRGRQAAEAVLRSRYEFMTVEGDEEPHVYDEETGVFTQSLADIRGEIHDGLGQYWSTHDLNEILSRLTQQNIVQPRDLNGRGAFDDPHVCVGNGVLNLFTRELKEHSPEYLFVERVPTAYDPDASTEPYEEFVGGLVDREQDKLAMLEMVGHALMPDANERYKKFLILTGDADNGKSQFYQRVADLLCGADGEENNVASVKLAKLAQNQFSSAAMYGHMANIAGEIDGKKIRNTASIKDITGGDEIEIEPKGKESFFDTINSTLMFAANDPPILGERDKQAIASRIVPIILPYVFVDDPTGEYEKQKIPESELRERLTTDEALSGFLNLALDGIERLEANGGDVSLPESETERLKRYERAADPMQEFGQKCLTNADGDYVVKADIVSIYKEFAAEQGYEIGSYIDQTLFDVLRGIPDLKITESRPEGPNYEDTTLPLRGWDERKRIIDRVSLTDEGLRLADQAGLVEDDGDAEREADPTPALAALSPQYGAEFEARVAAHSEGEYTRVAQGQLEGPHGSRIGFVIPGGNDDPLADCEGESVRLRGVTLRTDDDGLLQAVINDGVEVVTLEDGQSGLDAATAAADGGHVDDDDGDDEGSDDADTDNEASGALKPQILMFIRDEHAGGPVPADAVVDHFAAEGWDADVVEARIDDVLAEERIALVSDGLVA